MKSAAEILASIKGKTIENIAGVPSKNTVKEITLYFTDGTAIEMFPSVLFHGNENFGAEVEIEINEIID